MGIEDTGDNSISTDPNNKSNKNKSASGSSK